MGTAWEHVVLSKQVNFSVVQLWRGGLYQLPASQIVCEHQEIKTLHGRFRWAWRSTLQERGGSSLDPPMQSKRSSWKPGPRGNSKSTACPCTLRGWEINVSTCSIWNLRSLRWTFGSFLMGWCWGCRGHSAGVLWGSRGELNPFSPCLLLFIRAKVWARHRMRADNTANREFQNELIV